MFWVFVMVCWGYFVENVKSIEVECFIGVFIDEVMDVVMYVNL